jgi:hypothetical protein
MDAGKRTARYCLEIIEERLPHDVREALRARAEAEGRTVQNIILQALAKDGILEAEIGGSDLSVDAALESASVADDPNLRSKALPAWIRFLRRNGLIQAKALDVVRVATMAPTDSGRLRDAGWLVDALVPEHMDVARCVLDALVRSNALERLGRQGLRNLRSTLRAPVRKWMAEASEEAAKDMLFLVRSMPPELGCLVVEAAAKRSFAALQAEFALLIVDPKVPAEVRGYAEEHIRIRRTVATTAPWQALDGVVWQE